MYDAPSIAPAPAGREGNGATNGKMSGGAYRRVFLALWFVLVFVVSQAIISWGWDELSTGECLHFDYNERHWPSTEWWVEYCSNNF